MVLALATAAAGCSVANPDFAVLNQPGGAAPGDAGPEAVRAADAREAGARDVGPTSEARLEVLFAPAELDANPDPDDAGAEAAEAGPVEPTRPRADGAPDALAPLDLAPERPAEVPPGPQGLRGEYYEGREFNRLVFTRIDAAIDFDWGLAAPDPRMAPDRFSVRWTGYVVPRYSETYAFFTTTDDGVRLWLDGELVIDRWMNQPALEHATSIRLVAGRRISIKLEFYDQAAAASARLTWASASQDKEVVRDTHPSR